MSIEIVKNATNFQEQPPENIQKTKNGSNG
jgi:hypothetical protein